jgi:hypothetical protein
MLTLSPEQTMIPECRDIGRRSGPARKHTVVWHSSPRRSSCETERVLNEGPVLIRTRGGVVADAPNGHADRLPAVVDSHGRDGELIFHTTTTASASADAMVRDGKNGVIRQKVVRRLEVSPPGSGSRCPVTNLTPP